MNKNVNFEFSCAPQPPAAVSVAQFYFNFLCRFTNVQVIWFSLIIMDEFSNRFSKKYLSISQID